MEGLQRNSGLGFKTTYTCKLLNGDTCILMESSAIEIIGWVGSLNLMLCSLPQLVKTWKTKSVEGLSLVFLLSWWLGMVLMTVYILVTSVDLILIINYGFNSVVISLILYKYLLFLKNQKTDF